MLNIDNTVFIIIDIQEKLVKAVNDMNSISANAEKLIKLSNFLSVPLIVTEQYPKGLGETIETVKNKFQQTKVIEKTSFSAFQESDFKQNLELTGKKTAILAGIETHICVAQTAIDLQQNGYEVFVLKNVTASRTEFEHNSGLEIMKQYGIKVITFEAMLFGLLKSSKHPQFKDVQKLIL